MATLLEKPEKISTDHYLLKFHLSGSEPAPGQFINIKVSNSSDPLLRRPFSIFNYENDIINIVIKIIGKGTSLIRDFDTGDLDIIGPLGNGFSFVQNKKVLLIGGGVGNAPLYFLSKKLNELNNKISFIYGSKSKEYIYLSEKFKSISDNFIITTDDGSQGAMGLTTDSAKELLLSENFDMIYTCGPTIMMRSIVQLINDKTPIEVSVENYFGCGIGLCSGCTVETTNGLLRACVNGPVFDGKSILWDKFPGS